MKIEGKKILFLGGATFQVPAIKLIKESGCFLVLADYNPNAPGIVFADKYINISTNDRKSLLAVAKEYEIDGVMTYASDSSVASVAYIAKALNLPGNPPESADIIRRKDLFREFQKLNGLPYPEFISVSTLHEALEGSRTLSFPLVFKPVDSAGTKGQSVIYGKNEVIYAFEKAHEKSKIGKIIIEEYLSSDMMELDGDIWFYNSKMKFRHYGHNYFLKNRISNVPSGEIFPGFYNDNIKNDLDHQFDTIIQKLNLLHGCMNFDGIVSRGKVYIIDAGLRNGGNFVPDLIKYSTGFDLTSAAVFSALGIEYFPSHFSNKKPFHVASYLIGSRFHGRFAGIEYADEIKPYLVEEKYFLKIGDDIFPYSKADLAAGIAFFKFPSVNILKKKMEQIEDLIRLNIEPIRPRDEKKTLFPFEFKYFREHISPFLRKKISDAETKGDNNLLRILNRQYVETVSEQNILEDEGLKHYDAEEKVIFNGYKINGIERLYRRVILFELFQHCAARCRYCLRRNYDPWNHTKDDILNAAKYIGQADGHSELREVLVTGGDPAIVPDKLDLFLSSIDEFAEQIEIVRIATRVPVHQPDIINDKFLKVFTKKRHFRIEVATQINHALELFPEVKDAYKRILEVVPWIYNQTVLLAGINDTYEELIELFDRVRYLGIENHYFFQCVPIGGLRTFRVPLQKALWLARQVSQSGQISGRAKPKFALMTAIGKITLYDGTILDHKNAKFLLRSEYLYEDRLKWNPSYKLPDNSFIDANGYLCTWYEDAE